MQFLKCIQIKQKCLLNWFLIIAIIYPFVGLSQIDNQSGEIIMPKSYYCPTFPSEPELCTF